MTTAAPEIQRRDVPPREDLMRMAPFALRAGNGEGEPGDGRTLDGYAAVFNQVTVIDSWEGRFKERVAPGSMKKSFRETPPKIQFDHGRHPLIGSIPIAKLVRVAEEADPVLAPEGGAHVVGRLHENWLVEPVREAIASQSVNGMSFRFSVVQEEWHDPAGRKITDEQELRDLLRRSWMEELDDDELLTRTLKALKVPELGPVTWPAYTGTSVGARSVTIDLGRLHEPDQRALLARAVMLADRAESGESLQQATGDESAGEHMDEPNDPQRSTDSASAGEHESIAPDLRARIKRAAAFNREYLALTLKDQEV